MGITFFPLFFFFFLVGIVRVLGFGIGLNREDLRECGAIPEVLIPGSASGKSWVGKTLIAIQSLDTERGEFLGDLGGKNSSFPPSFPPEIRPQPAENPLGIRLGKNLNSHPKSGPRDWKIPRESAPAHHRDAPEFQPQPVENPLGISLGEKKSQFPPKILSQPVENPSGIRLGKSPHSHPKSDPKEQKIPWESSWNAGMQGREMKWDKP